MTIIDAVKDRRSIRSFQDKKVDRVIIDKLKEALIWAPSAGNLQARKFFFIFKHDYKMELSAAAQDQSFIGQAPLVIVACQDSNIKMHYGERGENLYTIQDVAVSLMSMMLVAHENGLGTVWVGAFNDKKVSRLLELQENLKPVAIVPVGHAASIPSAPERIDVQYAVTEII